MRLFPALVFVSAPACVVHGGPEVAAAPESAPPPLDVSGPDAAATVAAACAVSPALDRGLVVRDTDWTDLHALDCFLSIDGPVSVRDNPALRSLDGLPVPAHLTGSLVVTGNPSLTALRGLDELVQVDGDVVITGVPALEDLWGLHRLRVVEGDLLVAPDQPGVDATLLTVVDRVGGQVRVAGMDRLADLPVMAANE